MSPLAILLIGMVVVVGGVLFLRLHAFLALIVGALLVAALTPAAAVYKNELVTASFEVVEPPPPDAPGRAVVKAGAAEGLVEGGRLLVFRPQDDSRAMEEAAELEVVKIAEDASVVQAVEPADFELLPSDLIVHPVAAREAWAMANESIGERVATGFGLTCLEIGILIAMAAIVGKCLLDSGGAERIVFSSRRALGDDRTPLAMLVSSFILGIPVFFDTVFYLMIPLGKAMAVRTKKNYLFYILSIIAGGAIAHSLVPPTPGPLLVAAALDIDLGLMIMMGCIVGSLIAVVAYFYAKWANTRFEVPLRESVELTAEQLKEMAERDETTLPPLWLSLLPILLPVILISGSTIFDMLRESGNLTPALLDLGPVVESLGNKNIALTLAAFIAIGTLAWHKRASRKEVAHALEISLTSGGVVILITAAGGAFGLTLRQTGIAHQIGELIPVAQTSLLLPLAFLITAVVRVAQGSATVSMITGVGIVAPLAASGALPFHPVYLALAIGCGSKPGPWMNDSGFWVISKMSGMTEQETLKTFTVIMSLMGVVGLLITMLLASLVPLV